MTINSVPSLCNWCHRVVSIHYSWDTSCYFLILHCSWLCAVKYPFILVTRISAWSFQAAAWTVSLQCGKWRYCGFFFVFLKCFTLGVCSINRMKMGKRNGAMGSAYVGSELPVQEEYIAPYLLCQPKTRKSLRRRNEEVSPRRSSTRRRSAGAPHIVHPPSTRRISTSCDHLFESRMTRSVHCHFQPSC